MNREKGEIAFEAEGRTFRLKFGFNALVELEGVTGKAWDELEKLLASPSLSLIRQMLWAGLQEHHPELSVRDVGCLIDGIGAAEAMRRIEQGFATATPEGVAENPPQSA